MSPTYTGRMYYPTSQLMEEAVEWMHRQKALYLETCIKDFAALKGVPPERVEMVRTMVMDEETIELRVIFEDITDA